MLEKDSEESGQQAALRGIDACWSIEMRSVTAS